MALQRIEYTAENLLDCADTTNAPIILCIEPDLIAPTLCPEDAIETIQYVTIEATLISYSKFCISNKVFYRYLIEYDDTQLANPLVPLECTDILGMFCEGCLKDFIDETIGNEVYIETLNNVQTLVSQHGCRYEIQGGGGVPGTGIPNNFFFGDGSDNDFTVLNGQDLLNPYPAYSRHYENLTIDAGGVFHPYGYIRDNLSVDSYDRRCFLILVKDTLTINGTLSFDGLNGVNGSSFTGGVSPEPWARGGPGGEDCRGGNGGNGANGGNAAQIGGNPDFVTGAFLGRMGGGLGGGGGNSGAITGLTPTIPNYGYPWKVGRLITSLAEYDVMQNSYQGLAGGGSGGGGGAGGTKAGNSLGGGGGSGGAGAGCLYIAARNIVIGGAGKLSVRGGNGGKGANATLVDLAADGGGGGGGGGGGLIYLAYETFINNGTIDLSGGTAEVGGSGVNGGNNGLSGTSGADGNIYRLNFLTGIYE